MSSPSSELVLGDALARVDWQPVVLAAEPRRLDLLSLSPSWPTRELRVRVHRNTAVEYVASLTAPFLAYAGLAATFEYSDYDDSLSSATAGDGTADVELVWLDLDRFGTPDPALAEWLAGRLEAMRSRTVAPLLVVDAPDPGAAAFNQRLGELCQAIPGVTVADLSTVAARVGDAFVDQRTRDLAGTRMSGRATVLAAQRLGLRWLPAVTGPGIKALAVDLDMTLYRGVLGEDGPGGVVLTEEHERLQRVLRDLRDEGVLLALVSRNEPSDVEALFAARPDFPLQLSDFTARAIGWGAKSEGVAAAAAALRISTDAVVLVDDNVGELAEVGTNTRIGGLVHAVDPAATADALALFPGLHGRSRTREDGLRAADLQAATERARGAGGDPQAYLRSLQVRLSLALDAAALLPRAAELAAKTNQFNAALRRTGQAELARWLAADDVHVVTAALADRLSDSGVVALVAGRRDAHGRVVVDELCISCRALGRGIEDVLLAAAVGRLMEEFGADATAVAYLPGPRNEPARRWLADHSRYPVDEPGEVLLTWDAAACRALLSDSPVAVTWEGRRP